MNNFDSPILFLIFNRPEETEKVFEVIRQVAPRYLYISADGPRANKQGEEELCKRARDIVRNVTWPCNVKTLFRDKNSGCKKTVSEAINWFFSEEEQGIILEDDCLPDLTFFPYCKHLLEKYKNDSSIISIGGTNLGYEFPNESSYGFSRFMNMWGWATWRRSAILIDYEMKNWKKIVWKKFYLHRKLQDNFFDFDYNLLKLWSHYFDQTALGKMNTWDYQWIFTQIHYNKVSIFPRTNLIKNIGYSETATHTLNPHDPLSNLSLGSIDFPLQEPNSNEIDLFYLNNFIKKIWFTYRKESAYKILRSTFLNTPVIFKTINKYRGKKGYNL